MADDIDFSQEQQQCLHDARINQARARAGKLEFEATGKCLNCGEALRDGIRFCDADCRDDFERLNKMQGR